MSDERLRKAQREWQADPKNENAAKEFLQEHIRVKGMPIEEILRELVGMRKVLEQVGMPTQRPGARSRVYRNIPPASYSEVLFWLGQPQPEPDPMATVRERLEEAQGHATTVACPRCYAAPGELCRDMIGSHLDRVGVYYDLMRQPPNDVTCPTCLAEPGRTCSTLALSAGAPGINAFVNAHVSRIDASNSNRTPPLLDRLPPWSALRRML